MKNKKLLIAAEYTSLGLSVLGTIFATTTGQFVFAVTPLILALSLNLVNRKDLNRISLLEAQVKTIEDSLQKQIDIIGVVLDNKLSREQVQQLNQAEVIAIKQKIDSSKNNLELQINNLEDSPQKQIDTIGNILNNKLSYKQVKQLNQQEVNNIKQEINLSKTNLELQINTLEKYLQKQIDNFTNIINIRFSQEKIQQLTKQNIDSSKVNLELKICDIENSLQTQIITTENIISDKSSMKKSIGLLELNVEELKKLYKDNKIETMIRKQLKLELTTIVDKLISLSNQINNFVKNTDSKKRNHYKSQSTHNKESWKDPITEAEKNIAAITEFFSSI